MNSTAAPFRKPAEHYENFPVASWLCPPTLRPPIAAIYWFARTADDIADEGSAAAGERLHDLSDFRDDLLRVAGCQSHSGRWPGVFDALAPMFSQFQLPTPLLLDLLDAFRQDVEYTAAARRYQTDQELLGYCQRSANPVGRLLLHLYGIDDADALRRSDLVCTALQLINFWQDLRTDIARERWYPSVQTMTAHGVHEDDLRRDQDNPRASVLVAAYAGAAARMMHQGAPLARQIPGRAGWELRLVVQGGLRILEKMAAMNHRTWRERPSLQRSEVPLLLWRAWRNGRPRAGTAAT